MQTNDDIIKKQLNISMFSLIPYPYLTYIGIIDSVKKLARHEYLQIPYFEYIRININNIEKNIDNVNKVIELLKELFDKLCNIDKFINGLNDYKPCLIFKTIFTDVFNFKHIKYYQILCILGFPRLILKYLILVSLGKTLETEYYVMEILDIEQENIIISNINLININ